MTDIYRILLALWGLALVTLGFLWGPLAIPVTVETCSACFFGAGLAAMFIAWKG